MPTPTRYLSIVAVGRPVAFAVDTSNRVMFTMNFDAHAAAPITKFEEEIYRILYDAGLAVLNTDTFIGPAAVLPTGPGPYLTIINTGGYAPDHTHNGDLYERPSCQIVVRAISYTVARDRAMLVWRTLNNLHNVEVTAA